MQSIFRIQCKSFTLCFQGFTIQNMLSALKGVYISFATLSGTKGSIACLVNVCNRLHGNERKQTNKQFQQFALLLAPLVSHFVPILVPLAGSCPCFVPILVEIFGCGYHFIPILVPLLGSCPSSVPIFCRNVRLLLSLYSYTCPTFGFLLPLCFHVVPILVPLCFPLCSHSCPTFGFLFLLCSHSCLTFGFPFPLCSHSCPTFGSLFPL